MEMLDRQEEGVGQVFQSNHNKFYWNALFCDAKFGQHVTEVNETKFIPLKI